MKSKSADGGYSIGGRRVHTFSNQLKDVSVHSSRGRRKLFLDLLFGVLAIAERGLSLITAILSYFPENHRFQRLTN